MDWHIKWSVEHGITVWMINWYWDQGRTWNQHFVSNGLRNARYRDYIKWCLHWCNWGHSEQDQRIVTQYWIDHYFKYDSYYRIDDKPVIAVWTQPGMVAAMGSQEGVKKLLDISQEVAREAGYKGVYFIMISSYGGSPRWRDQGWANTAHYLYAGRFMETPETYEQFSFEAIADAIPIFWQKVWEKDRDVMPFIPPLSAGWDPRGWHGDQGWRIYGRTPELFRRICNEARTFCEKTGIRRLTAGALNEWGEGHYLEPSTDFGFAMFDAIRDVFCKRPEGGWPPNIIPEDVGLGPYEFPPGETRTVWSFTYSEQMWGALMGINDLRAEDGALQFTTASHDPALKASIPDFPASQYPTVVITMRIGESARGQEGQLFFSSSTAGGISAENMVGFPLIADGKYHEYALPMWQNPNWVGMIGSFRLDPCGSPDVEVAITQVRLEESLYLAPQDWSPLMGITDLRAEEGTLHLTTTSIDPAIRTSVPDIDADQFPTVIIRMKIDQAPENDHGQLFWSTDNSGISAEQLVGFKLIGDGKYHDYVLPMAEHPRWRGHIEGLRFDPCGSAGARVAIEQVRFCQKQ